MAIEPEIVDREVAPSGTALDTVTRAEIDMQIATAKRYPRSIERFKKTALDIALCDEETAMSCYYVMPRDGKNIEGPSIRTAEIIASTWGNVRYGSRIVEEGERHVTAQGMCHDLESNNAVTVEVTRRITNKNGQRYGDDMIGVAKQAACSIALRNAIFKVIPQVYAKQIYEKAKEFVLKSAEVAGKSRQDAVAWFAKAGATEAQVLAFLGRRKVNEVTAEDVVTLRGLATAIKDGDTTVEAALNIASAQPHKRAAVVETPKSASLPYASDFAKCGTVEEVRTLHGTLIGELPPDEHDAVEIAAQARRAQIGGAK